MAFPIDRADAAAPRPVWTVAAVARRLGVSSSTLRSWSLRYGIGPAGHHPGRHRRYTAADVAELETIRHLTDQGIVLPAAAVMARNQRPTGTEGPVSAETVQRLMTAARHLDADTPTALLEASLTTRGVVATWNQLCRPALAAFDKEGCIDAALLLSWVIATSLRRLPARLATSGTREVLLACVWGEQHTLALEALLAALAAHHIGARMLGPSVPTPALLHAVEQVHPAVIVVWAQVGHVAKPIPLHKLCTHAHAVLAAGPGWQHVALPPAVTTTGSLQDALALVLQKTAQLHAT